MDLKRTEQELRKRLSYPYRWGRQQSDSWDKKTNFIYKTYSFETLLNKINNFDQTLRNYAMNRWYNFWSAMAVENIFTSHNNVSPNINSYDKLVDFSVNEIPFDHKTSVFPRGFNKSIQYAVDNKKKLIQWLYDNQSQQGRKHFGNRLFIILYDKDNNHWKMKCEIMLLKSEIDKYVRDFSKNNLCTFDFGKGTVYADIIWLINK